MEEPIIETPCNKVTYSKTKIKNNSLTYVFDLFILCEMQISITFTATKQNTCTEPTVTLIISNEGAVNSEATYNRLIGNVLKYAPIYVANLLLNMCSNILI